METVPVNFLIKDSPATVAILDSEMRFISHSDVWKQEHAPLFDSIIGKVYYDILPETPNVLRKAYDECLKGASSQNEGVKIVAPDGTSKWLTWRVNHWKHENGTIGGLIVTLKDITVTKRREELLLKAEQVARIGGWEVDLATNEVFWTDVTQDIHEVSRNYKPNLEEGINFYKAGTHREEITRLVSEAIKDGTPWDTDLIIVTAKGNELWVRAKGETEMVDGKCTRLFGTFQDIDEQKKFALNYKNVTDRLTVSTVGGNFGIFTFDIVNNVLDWDDSMYRIYGVAKDDFTGEYEAWRSGLHPEDVERCDKEVAMAISGEKDFDSEFRIIWPNGEIRHIRGIIVMQRDEDGNAIKMMGTNWDITQRVIAEKKLSRSIEVTKEQNESLLNFAHIVSHNLRSHSSNLSMLTGFLTTEQNETERQNLLGMLNDASKSLSETVMHLNEVVQVKVGASDKMKSVNLYKTLDNVKKNLSVLIQEKKASCHIDVPKNLCIEAIPAYLDSILLNLFTNSLKYSSPDRAPKIRISSKQVGDNTALTFSDNGLGIDLDRHGEKLFGMYKTFHRNKDAKGIGLFITKNQIEAMNGKIEVESTVDVGTTFTLYFQSELI